MSNVIKFNKSLNNFFQQNLKEADKNYLIPLKVNLKDNNNI